ncbi:MAG: type I restriction-modification enzyme R subunit C-terminal domain-containing protein [Candidatus Methanomethylicaceae archaeon]
MGRKGSFSYSSSLRLGTKACYGGKERFAITASRNQYNKKSLKEMINTLLNAVDPDKQIEKAKAIYYNTDTPTEEQIKKAAEELVKIACTPFDNPKFRNTIIDIKKRSEQIIDTVSKDEVLFAGFGEKAKEKARQLVNTFKKFIEENKNELTALQIIYSKPYGKRQLTYGEIKELAEAITEPPYLLTAENLWQAYKQLDQSRVRGAGPQKLLADIASLVRFAIGESDDLEPFSDTVNQRFASWVVAKEKGGIKFTPTQMEWLMMIKDHIATSLSIKMDDFELAPFYEKGGAMKVYNLFGKELNTILNELNEALAV